MRPDPDNERVASSAGPDDAGAATADRSLRGLPARHPSPFPNPDHPDGPSVVAVGGGHGLAATLRAARRYAGQITAVVSVADDGGSSGRLRETLGVVALGDLRRCLSALADERSLLGSSLEHRFPAGDLAGHPMGNVLLAGLVATAPDLVSALDEVARSVGAVGRVLPTAVEPVTLIGSSRVPRSPLAGQMAVQNAEGVTGVGLEPSHPAAPPEVVDSIARADQIVLGPGSLFTSVLAAAVVPDVLDALRRSAARKVYVCNLRPQPPETAGFTMADHVEAMVAHGVPVDVVLCHADAGSGDVDPQAAGEWPAAGPIEWVTRPVARPASGVHDPVLLGAALADLARAAVPAGSIERG